MNNEKNTSSIEDFDDKKQDKKSKKSKLIFFYITIVILVIIFLLICQYFYIKYIFNVNNLQEDHTNTTQIYQNSSETTETSRPLTVKGAEHLEIIGLNINSNDSKMSNISAKIKNNSNKSYKDIKLRITLYDNKNIEITSLDYQFDNIKANKDISIYASIKKDLSNCENYAISLIDK